MIQIRPVSDLRNKFPDIEKAVGGGEPVYLTKNGYGAMVVLSLEAYSRLTDGVEVALDEADRYASENEKRYTHEEVFSNLRRRVNGWYTVWIKVFAFVLRGFGTKSDIYISETLHNEKAANDLLDAVEKAIMERLPIAEAFEPYRSVKERQYKYYRIYVKNFVIYYVVIDDIGSKKIMEVRRFLYNKQDREQLI